MVVQLKPTLPVLLSFNGGYVDTAGYLALQGLFTSSSSSPAGRVSIFLVIIGRFCARC
jgi:uncharacterized membrane protein YoaK (UPF0700 family)